MAAAGTRVCEGAAAVPAPAGLDDIVAWQGRLLKLRPIRPEDEPRHRAYLASLDPEDVRLRVFYTRRTIEHSEMARLTSIDYDREMAFVATVDAPEGGEQALGVVRGLCDPDNLQAEFGIVVR